MVPEKTKLLFNLTPGMRLFLWGLSLLGIAIVGVALHYVAGYFQLGLVWATVAAGGALTIVGAIYLIDEIFFEKSGGRRF